MSNEREQFQRFQMVISPYILFTPNCELCPLKQKCHAPDAPLVEHTCEETLWHYIKTGDFLI